MQNKLEKLRAEMVGVGVDCYILATFDEFLNEYVPSYNQRLTFLTGFNGSAGTVLVLKDQAIFFTDGRYMLQAAAELDTKQYKIVNVKDCDVIHWLKQYCKENFSSEEGAVGLRIGLESWLFSYNTVKKYEKLGEVKICSGLIDKIWLGRPDIPLSLIYLHDLKYAGISYPEKLDAITAFLKLCEADYLLITMPESACWLLNIRGRDVASTPLLLSRLLIAKDGTATLFANLSEADLASIEAGRDEVGQYFAERVVVKHLNKLELILKEIKTCKIIADCNHAPYFVVDLLAKNNEIIHKDDPTLLPRACKNEAEIKGAIDAHIRDAVALNSFLVWLYDNIDKIKHTEISITEKLLEFRSKNSLFVMNSFDTIAGSGSNGAIIHYRANAKSNQEVTRDKLLLLDSGGQYLSGTTDVTRTIIVGKASKEQILQYTLVLKGNIALSQVVFPFGTTGSRLDILARQFLWQHGLDYDHGTGHGVGSFLSVHEGGVRISKIHNDMVLRPGMIVSNEPGYYKDGSHGIRFENLLLVTEYGGDPAGLLPENYNKKEKIAENKNSKFLCFRVLTLVPADPGLIDFSLLTAPEISWLKSYHSFIYNELKDLVDEKVAVWLKSFK